jgi:hypothetical protein
MQRREAIRYLQNAKELLNQSSIEDSLYTDEKYVKSAFGIVYLGVLKSIDEYLLNKGLTKKELPKKVEEYEKALKKYLSVYNGKLLNHFKALYNELHIAGYYRGNILHMEAVKAIFKAAKGFIEKLK